MEVLATERAADVVRRVAASGREVLVLVLGTGCCDSTAPYLYDRYLPGADAVRVGEVAAVPVFAPAFLDRLYPGPAGLVLDVEEGVLSDSLSLESELGCRFVLRLREPHPAAG